MRYPALAIANYFYYRSRAEGFDIDPLKMQKLLYFANGWHLAVYGKPLIREPIRAWQYGPVIESVYHAFKGYGARSISEPFDPENFEIPPDDFETREFLNRVWANYGGYTGVELSNLSHDPDGPWAEAMNSSRFGSPRISDASMRDYFIRIAEEAEP
jgi:uncharacterized phage-associated protein